MKVTREMFRLPPYRPASLKFAWAQTIVFGVALTSQTLHLAHAMFFGAPGWWWWVFTSITFTIDFVMTRWALEGVRWWYECRSTDSE